MPTFIAVLLMRYMLRLLQNRNLILVIFLTNSVIAFADVTETESFKLQSEVYKYADKGRPRLMPSTLFLSSRRSTSLGSIFPHSG